MLGIDGCRGGWVWCRAVWGEPTDRVDWTGGVAASLAELGALIEAAALALIDMPIGLLEAGPDERACDRAARALLGRPRASSVFRPPCRAALAAANYADACAINRAHTGVALSIQTWHLLPKLRELDALLTGGPAGLHERVREAHPELCLFGLAGGRAMVHAKRTAAGRAERLALLGRHGPAAAALVQDLSRRHPRRQLAADDSIDAATLAITAWRLVMPPAGPAVRRCLPDPPPRDAAGLPMALWYVMEAAG